MNSSETAMKVVLVTLSHVLTILSVVFHSFASLLSVGHLCGHASGSGFDAHRVGEDGLGQSPAAGAEVQVPP